MSSSEPRFGGSPAHLEWWKQAVIYQIYPRSFQDSDGDGVGDLRGILARLDHLQRLGIDALWLSPIYRSPQVDNGYDTSSYVDIDPAFGTMGDFDELVGALHARGMRLILDLAVNHTSDQHPWFVESRSSRDNPKRDWYWWRPGRNPADSVPEPTNWESFFSGPTWTLDEATDEYYLHLFAKEQPDLNWENPEVRQAVYGVMRFWLDRGVDGFRLDVINLISKHPDLPDGPVAEGRLLGDGFPFYSAGPRLHEFLQEMRREALSGHGELLVVGETPGVTMTEARALSDASRGELDMVFQFAHVDLDHDGGKFTPRRLRDGELAGSLAAWQEALAGAGWNSLYLSNHDQPRHVSRFGDDQKWWRESATALATALHLQRGTPFVYQGEEIGMVNGAFQSVSDLRDVESLNHYRDALARGEGPADVMASLRLMGRDNARTPVQWAPGLNAGFSEGTPWIEVNPNYLQLNAEAQYGQSGSVFEHYRALIELRHRLPVVVTGSFEALEVGNASVFAFLRTADQDALLVVVNLSSNPAADAVPAEWRNEGCILTNYPELASDCKNLAPWEARVYHRSGGSQENGGK